MGVRRFDPHPSCFLAFCIRGLALAHPSPRARQPDYARQRARAEPPYWQAMVERRKTADSDTPPLP
jgi:hypothetical protein